jgi:tRNA A-37 threonylcarbamoyl transferase component Bud32
MRPAIVKTDLKLRNSKLPGAAIGLAREDLSRHFGGVAVQVDGPISVRDNSEIFHAVIETGTPLEAAIKYCLIPHTTVPDDSAATEQFVALELVHNAFASRDGRFRVPTPLHLAPATASYAMGWVDGESLTRKLQRPAVFMEGPDWFEAVGAWLGNFHSAGPCRRQFVCLDERLSALEDLRLFPVPDPSFARAIQTLQKTAPQLKGIEVEASWLHGDCKTDNFFLSGENVYGIDISLRYENPVEYDLAQFLNNLDLLLGSPQYPHLSLLRSRLEKAFWRGYRSTGPAVSHTCLDWLRLNFLLSLWRGRLEGRRRSIRKWLLNRMFGKLAARLSGKLASTYSHLFVTARARRETQRSRA